MSYPPNSLTPPPPNPFLAHLVFPSAFELTEEGAWTERRMDLELEEIRRRIITAVASDDDLMQTLVLKGGNALRVVHDTGERSSVDIDYSLSGDLFYAGGKGGKIEKYELSWLLPANKSIQPTALF